MNKQEFYEICELCGPQHVAVEDRWKHIVGNRLIDGGMIYHFRYKAEVGDIQLIDKGNLFGFLIFEHAKSETTKWAVHEDGSMGNNLRVKGITYVPMEHVLFVSFENLAPDGKTQAVTDLAALFIDKTDRSAPLESDATFNTDNGRIVVTSSDPSMQVDFGDGIFRNVPATKIIDGELGINYPLSIRYGETTMYYASPVTHVEVFVEKMDRPAPLPSDMSHSLDGDILTATSTKDDIVISINGGEFGPPPVEYTISGELNVDVTIRFRFKETDRYNESPVTTKTVFVPKEDRDAPDTSAISLEDTGSGAVAVSGGAPDIEISVDGGEWKHAPFTEDIPGELGRNVGVRIRYIETPVYSESPYSTKNIFVSKMDRIAPEQGDISYTIDGTDINVTSVTPEIVVSFNGGEFVVPPVDYTVSGELNVDVAIGFKFKETDRYKDSPITTTNVFIPKADRDGEPPSADVITLEDTGGVIAVSGGDSDIEISVDGGEWKHAPLTEDIPGDLGREVEVRIRYIETDEYNPSEITTTTLFVAKLPQDPPTHDDYEIEIGQGSVTITQVFN